MGRYLFPALFVVVLLLPFALRLAVASSEPDQAPADLDEATARISVVTPHNADIRNQFEAAFRRWHQEKYVYVADVDYRNIGGSNDIVKALTVFYGQVRKDHGGELPPPEEVQGAPYNVVWGGGDYVFNVDLEGNAGALQAIELPSDVMAAAFPEGELGGIDLYDRDDDGVHWFGVCLSSFGIVYSPFVYDRLGLEPPATWTDLTRSALNGRVVLADPGKSGSAAVAYMMVVQRAMADAEEAFFATGKTADDDGYEQALDAGWAKGTGDLLIMAANARFFTDSASAVPAEVSHANAAAGTAIDFYGRVEEETVGVDRIQYVSPKAATAVTPDPVAVCYGTTGDELTNSTHFIEFLLSPEAQRLWQHSPDGRPLRRTPIRSDVFADTTGWSDPDDNPFETSGGFNQRGEWMGTFTEARLAWKASWIESGEALDEAYSAVLAVEDEARRDELLGELRDLPFMSRSAIAQLRVDRKAQPPAEQASFLAKASSDLAAKSREHYEQVKAAARSE